MNEYPIFPWVDIFRLALLRGITPDAAWNMTPNTIFNLIDLNHSPRGMSRREFDDLVTRFPDDTPTSPQPHKRGFA